MRYFLHIAYNGANYRGWQAQGMGLSLQEVIEKNISKIFKTPISCNGCGRTDAQVHASQYFLHFDIKEELDFDLVFRLNKILPDDISVFDVIPVAANCHARFDAGSRTYDYFIHTYKDPFLSTVSSLYLEQNLDLDKMKQAVALLPKYNDFRAFCKTPDSHNSTICQVTSAKLFSAENGQKIRFEITANRFLRGMIRIIVEKLLQVGTGNLTIEEFEDLLVKKETPRNLKFAYPQGLFLSKINYPYLMVPSKTVVSGVVNDWEEV